MSLAEMFYLVWVLVGGLLVVLLMSLIVMAWWIFSRFKAVELEMTEKYEKMLVHFNASSTISALRFAGSLAELIRRRKT